MDFINGMLSSIWNNLTPDNQQYYLQSGANNLYGFDPGIGAASLLGGNLNSLFDAKRNPLPTYQQQMSDAKQGIVGGPLTSYQNAATHYTNQFNNANQYNTNMQQPTYSIPSGEQPSYVFNPSQTTIPQSQQPNGLTSMFNNQDIWNPNMGFQWGNYMGNRG